MGVTAPLTAPFPWFGGKSRAARLIWAALGDVDNYVEPFFGSGAFLLGRPRLGGIETVNDADGLLANVWRALAADPDAVARHADWPVSECDLTARHLWLVGQRESLTARLVADPEWYDARAAGWWIWGACCWIGNGWCSGRGPWSLVDGEVLSGNAGMGIHRQLPHLGNAGMGIHRKLPHLGDAGMGIHRKLPHLGDAGRGIAEWFSRISDRLRRVRICCGDWSRVVTPSVTHRHGLTGVVLDPPYTAGSNVDDCYAGQDRPADELWREVIGWASEQGARSDMRVVLCGYEGMGEVPSGWRSIRWTARKGYQSKNSENGDNPDRERLWLSPACLDVAGLGSVQGSLFGRVG